MDDIYQNLGQVLNWSHVKNAGLILHAGDNQTPLAQIITKGAYASIAEGQSGGVSWKFSRSGFLKNNVSIADKDGHEIGAFKKKGPGGFLEVEGGKQFEITRNGLMTQYGLSFGKQPLILCQIVPNHIQVSLTPEAKDCAELPLLVLFLAYLMIMQRVDASFSMP